MKNHTTTSFTTCRSLLFLLVTLISSAHQFGAFGWMTTNTISCRSLLPQSQQLRTTIDMMTTTSRTSSFSLLILGSGTPEDQAKEDQPLLSIDEDEEEDDDEEEGDNAATEEINDDDECGDECEIDWDAMMAGFEEQEE